MIKQDLEKIIHYIVEQGLAAVAADTAETDVIIDYLSIFARDDKEFKDLAVVVKTLGTVGDEAMNKTGITVILRQPISTVAGELKVLKIRKPDATRPQRGAPDFRVNNYSAFKEKYLQSSGNFTLMIRKDYEMIELKGVDVLVYFPSKVFIERKISNT